MERTVDGRGGGSEFRASTEEEHLTRWWNLCSITGRVAWEISRLSFEEQDGIVGQKKVGGDYSRQRELGIE